MARIGEFGAAERELSDEKDDFVFCGEVFDVEQPMPAVLILQLGASISGKIDETEGFAAIWEAFRVSLTRPEQHRPANKPEDVDRPGDELEEVDGVYWVKVPADDSRFVKFYNLATERGVELNELMRLVMALFEAQTGRPTRRQPDLSVGPSTTSQNSSTSSTHPGLSHLRAVDDISRNPFTKPQADPNTIVMGDGETATVEYGPPPTSGLIG